VKKIESQKKQKFSGSKKGKGSKQNVSKKSTEASYAK